MKLFLILTIAIFFIILLDNYRSDSISVLLFRIGLVVGGILLLVSNWYVLNWFS